MVLLKGKFYQKEKINSKSDKNVFENFTCSHHIFPLAPLPSPYIYAICTKLPLI
jgi:hypothetical protein